MLAIFDVTYIDRNSMTFSRGIFAESNLREKFMKNWEIHRAQKTENDGKRCERSKDLKKIFFKKIILCVQHLWVWTICVPGVQMHTHCIHDLFPAGAHQNPYVTL